MIYPDVANLTKQDLKALCDEYRKNNFINPEISEKLGVKRGLRNPDGTGVLAGLTNVCDVVGYKKENDKVIGGTEIRNINTKDGTVGGGIWINENYQKNGYGTEAFSSKIKYCFEVLGLRRIENGYFCNNEKSRKMQLKLGYKDEGIRRKRFLCLATNQYVDECVTGLLREEFIEYNS